MNKIYKYCKAEHNVATGCRTIQLGTLDYYANLDPKSPSADRSEGNREKRGSAGVYSGEHISPLTPQSAKLKAGSGNNITVTDSIDIRAKETNGYIFSSSIDPANSASFPDYNSCFSIDDPELAALAIADLLSLQLSVGDLTEGYSSVSEFFIIQHEHRKVNYLDEDAFHFTDRTVVKAIENDRNDIAFTKPKKRGDKSYEREREYRLCFWVFDSKGKQQSVKKEPKLLTIPSVLERSFKPIYSHFLSKTRLCVQQGFSSVAPNVTHSPVAGSRRCKTRPSPEAP